MNVHYARWYSGQEPAVFRLYNNGRHIVRAEVWGPHGWEPASWGQIAGWVDPIHLDELPEGVTP